MEELKVFKSEFMKNDMLWENSRLKTFSRWPYTKLEKCTPQKMAAAGWYCTSHSRSDVSAKCAFCMKELNGWEPTDDPWKEHEKHSASCAFIKLKKSQAECTVGDMYTLLEERLISIMKKQYEENKKKLEAAHEDTKRKIREAYYEQMKNEA